MANDDDILVQLATRVPRSLHRDVKLYCVGNGISVMEFVSVALTAKLAGRSGARRGRPTRPRKR